MQDVSGSGRTLANQNRTRFCRIQSQPVRLLWNSVLIPIRTDLSFQHWGHDDQTLWVKVSDIHTDPKTGSVSIHGALVRNVSVNGTDRDQLFGPKRGSVHQSNFKSNRYHRHNPGFSIWTQDGTRTQTGSEYSPHLLQLRWEAQLDEGSLIKAGRPAAGSSSGSVLCNEPRGGWI